MSTVADVLEYIQYRADTDLDLLPTVNFVNRAIAKRLYYLNSDFLVKDFNLRLENASEEGDGIVIDGDSEITLATESVYAGFAELPSDFWGLKSEPYIDGYKYPLAPLPSIQAAMNLGEGGVPLYYKVKHIWILVYPPPATGAAMDCIAEYFFKPSKLTATSDTMPFTELFDDVVAEAIARFYKNGTQMDAENAGLFREFIAEQVDFVATKRERRTPVLMPQGIDWNAW